MPTSYQWFIGEFVPAIGRTLLHSLWQGMIAALIAGLIILCTRKTAASIRYNALLFLFGSLMATVALTFFLELRSSSISENAASLAFGASPIYVSEFTTSFESSQPNFITAVLAFVDRYAILLVSTWFLFFVFQLTRMAFGLKEISHIRNKRTSAPSEEWANWITRKSKELGISQSVLLLQSSLAKVPVAIGYFKPVILVPIGLLSRLSPAQVETVLLHELAHIKRKDYLVNLLQSFVDAIFFFNPAFVWLSSLIRQEREKCCDDMVIQYPRNQHNYLEALVSFQEMNLSSGYTMAIGSKKYYLLNRVKRILTRENSRLSIREAATLVVGIILFGIAFMAFKPISPEQTSPANFANEAVINQTQPIVSAAPAIKDTVPKKSKEPGERPLKFKKIISNIVDDGDNNTYQIQATQDDGTEYKIRRKGNEITSFSVNDKEIPKSQYDKYEITMDAIERARKKQLKHALNEGHEFHLEFDHQWDSLNSKFFDISADSHVLFNDSLQSHEHLFNQDENHELLFNLQLDNSFNQNPTIAFIVTDLLMNKLIQEENNISFSLTNTELIVNGKTQSKAMHEKFKSKYIKHPADRFKYSKQGKSTKTEIYTN